MNDVNASRAEAPAAVFALTLPYFSHSVRERSALPRHDASVTGVAQLRLRPGRGSGACSRDESGGSRFGSPNRPVSGFVVREEEVIT